MKKYFTLAILMAVCAISAQAQLEVDSLGKVIIGQGGYTTNNKLLIGSPLDNTAGVTISNVGSSTTMKLYKLSGDTLSTGFHLRQENPTGYNVGIYSTVNSYGMYTKEKPNMGLKGEAFDAKYNIGVYGQPTEDQFLTPKTAWIEGFGQETEGEYQVSAISLGYYTVDGDTLIDGKSYYRIRLNKVCHPFVYIEWDEQGREIIRDKEVETYDSDLCFFMREDESGDVWLYTDDVNTLGHISGNIFYYDIDQNYASGLVHHDLFLFNTRKPYSAGDKKPFGTIAFDSPEALYDGHNLFDWCIDSLEVKDVTGSVMLDGKEHWASIYDSGLKYVQGIGPLWAGGPLRGVGQPSSSYQRVFFAFYQGDQIIYRNEGYLSAIEEQFPDILNMLTGITNEVSPIRRGTSERGTGALYDLQGQRLGSTGLPKGIYIRNGKKIVKR